MTRTEATFFPPIPEAQRWIQGVTFPADRPLINLSQAAPADPPPDDMRAAMARMLEEPDTHLYGPVLGRGELRAALAEDWAAHYGGAVAPEQVAITAGCNQAFAACISALCTEGDEVIVPVPWYFNHKMWLDMSGVRAVPLNPAPADHGQDLVPDVAAAAGLITSRTRAIAIITPNNPCGVEYPADVVEALFDLCRARGIALIVDETYRDFDSRSGAPHGLLSRPDWDQTLIQLYSFSKAYRLTGHRVGAIIARAGLLHEMEKFQDTVAICAPSFGQKAAHWGLANLGDWKDVQRRDILDRRAAIEEHFPVLASQGWRLRGLGAYFAYLEHPFDMEAAALAPLLVQAAGVLMLPASMFVPQGDTSGERAFRMAFANATRPQLAEVCTRLAALDLPRRTDAASA